MRRSLIVNGPNMGHLGRRQPEIYGDATLDSLISAVKTAFAADDIAIDHFQSDIEGEIVHRLLQADDEADIAGIVLNAAAYTHTSVAIADAVAAIAKPVVEVHMSNVAAREQVRQRSLIAPYCAGTITGFGALSYFLAVKALIS